MLTPSVKLSASVIRSDLLNLEEVYGELEQAAIDYIHLDIADGHFAPTLGLPLDLINLTRKRVRCALDVHLLVIQPARYVKAISLEPSDQIAFHIEAVEVNALRATIELFRQTRARVGLALRHDSALQLVEPWLTEVDFVSLLSIPPGSYGLPLSKDALNRIHDLNLLIESHWPHLIIEVDGGVRRETAKSLAQAGGDILVCGSGIFNEEGIARSVRSLRELLHEI